MSIEEIPSDKEVVMTDIFHRAFNAAGCNPMCHCCEEMIVVNEYFKLATVKELRVYNLEYEKAIEAINDKTFKEDEDIKVSTREVMLCSKCTIDKFYEKEKQSLLNDITKRDKPRGGCFRINGKIVH